MLQAGVLFLEGFPELIHYRSRKQRLRNKGIHTGGFRFLSNVLPAVGSQDDDRRFMTNDFSNLSCCFNTVQFRHPPVYQNQIVGLPSGVTEPDHLDSIQPGQCFFTPDANLPQNNLRMFAGHGIIINGQYTHIIGMNDTVFFDRCCSVRIKQCDSNSEGRTFPFFAFYRNIAIHQLNDAFCDGHAEPRTAILAGRGGILLGESVEDLWQVFFAHADAGVPEGEAKGRFSVKLRDRLNGKGNRPAFRGKFDCVAEDVDHHLAQLHVVADIIVPDISAGPAVIFQALVPALTADNGIHLFQYLCKRELLALDCHTARFDPAHVQNIVDDAQQVIGGCADSGQILFHLFAGRRFVHGNVVQPNDGVHGGTDLMAHVGQECRLCLAGLLRCGERLRQRVIFGHGFAHFRIDHGKAHTYLVHKVIIPLTRMAHTGHAQHLVVFYAVSFRQIAIGHDGFCFKPPPYILRIDKVEEALPVFRIHIPLAVLGESCMVREVHSYGGLVRITRVCPIANGVIRVHIHMIDAPVVRRHGRDHAVQFLLAVFLSHNLLMQRKLFLQSLLFCTCLRFGGFDPGHLCYVHRHAQQAKPPRGFPESDFRRLQVMEISTCRIRHIFEKDIGLVHRQGFAVIFHKMIRSGLIEDLMVCKSDDFFRTCLARVFCKGLVAGKIFPRRHFLGEAHGGHIGQHRGDRTHQLCQPSCRLNFFIQPKVFCLGFFRVIKRFLISPSLTNLFIYVFKSHHNTDSPARHMDLSKVDPVMPRSGLQGSDKIDRKSISGLKLLQNVRQAHLLLHPFLIFWYDHGVYIFRLGFRIPGMAQRVTDSLVMDLIHIRMVQRHLLCNHIVDQVHSVISSCQRGNHRVPCGCVRFPLNLFICYVGDENNIDSSVGFGLSQMPVVVNPADSAVPLNDTVFGIIHLLVADSDLMNNGG